MSRLSEHSVPISLNFNNISLKIDDRQILDDVSGKVKPGQLLAIMGPSGSGKTTLLNILSGRLNADSGDVLINGKHITKQLKKKIGFVLQEDIFFSHITLKETLTYSALLRLPDTLSKQEKLQKVEEIVDILDIRKCLDTRIGSPDTRGLSGGEKKRANIGCELITNPSILFLDEPTSGLDSSNAKNLIQTLSLFAAQEKKTILMSIHQPSSQIFHLFDKLLLLCNGKIAFYGKASRVVDFFSSIGFECEKHFNPADHILEKVTAGKETEDFIVESWAKSAKKHKELKSSKGKEDFSNKEHLNNFSPTSTKKSDNENKVLSQENLSFDGSADIPHTSPKKSEDKVLSQENLSFDGSSDNESSVIDSVYTTPCHSPRDTTKMNHDKLPEVLTPPSSPNGHCITSDSELPMISFKKDSKDTHLDIHEDDDDEHNYSDVSTAWVTSFWTQFAVLTERTFKQSKPEIISKLNMIQTVLLAVLTGLIWFRTPYTEKSIRDRYAVIFFILTYWNFNPLFSALLSFPSERTVINKERAAGYYRLSAYYFAKLVSELPLVIFQPVLFLFIAYWMSGLNESVVFLQFVFSLLVMSITAQSVGLLISATVTDFKKCITVASVYGLGCMLLGGFYQQNIPSWLSWFEYVSYLRYAYDMLMISEFSTSKPFKCQELSVYESCINNGTYIQGTEVLEHLGVRLGFGENLACLILFGLIARVLTYYSLRFLHRPK